MSWFAKAPKFPIRLFTEGFLEKGERKRGKKIQRKKRWNIFTGKLVCLLALCSALSWSVWGKDPVWARELKTGHRHPVARREHAKISAITNHQNRRTLDCRRAGFLRLWSRDGLFLHPCDRDLFIAASEKPKYPWVVYTSNQPAN